ncbi:hypothetical protein WN55_01415 [Dufourea novaeangliae]|uniref:Uncharacterized protein n=1 Tax=Dufourea novaeangliae TaxID=178035 RepID=A0A154PEK7_DUFNO|nr:hypothetical protein WN55_01415 [Dufourea novaeangliae]
MENEDLNRRSSIRDMNFLFETYRDGGYVRRAFHLAYRKTRAKLLVLLELMKAAESNYCYFYPAKKQGEKWRDPLRPPG